MVRRDGGTSEITEAIVVTVLCVPLVAVPSGKTLCRMTKKPKFLVLRLTICAMRREEGHSRNREGVPSPGAWEMGETAWWGGMRMIVMARQSLSRFEHATFSIPEPAFVRCGLVSKP